VAEALEGFYKAAVGCCGVSPSDFWQMTFQEWWWIQDVKAAQAHNPAAFTHEDLRELDEWAAREGEKYRKP
jgi:hypothetical protein